MLLADCPQDDTTLLARTGIDPLPPASEGLFRTGSWLRRIHGESVLTPTLGLADTAQVRLITAALLPERVRDDFGLRFEAKQRARFDALVRSVRSLRAEADARSA